MTLAEFPFSHRQDVQHLTVKPLVVELRPDAAQLQRIAEAYSLVGLSDVLGRFELRRWRREGVAVEGALKARATQTCVVTLAPVEQVIDETFSMRFDPDADALAGVAEDGEIDVDAFAEDPPDLLEGSRIDLGAILCEQLALALDPFPRAPGAELPDGYGDANDDEVDDKPPSPFAVLERFRKRDE
ncbi:DUF177 domain-containing protein [Stappia sp. 28M-7]|uniref:YceD family protein n=1 Tax=Stappia sp. 28M-7 TaxID=2762596 RepID=UPI00163CE68E|nr:DUF177 domain-containing protein [Stappia sp. 28M-7]MBC2859337.1 DUF177 domain-containing protein [Stappia sp. 28M-7]